MFCDLLLRFGDFCRIGHLHQHFLWFTNRVVLDFWCKDMKNIKQQKVNCKMKRFKNRLWKL